MVSRHPMMAEQFVLFAILAAALVCFVWGRLRYDLIAVLALLAAVVSGVVPASEAFMGFGHPAVVTVAAILILSRALRNSDVVGWVSAALEPVAGHPTRQLLALTALTAACSAFMNNVGALALLLPVALHGAIAAKRPNSQLLMPLSFASLLGGLITLIGTPPNIVIANFRAEVNGEPFGMFDFAPVGSPISPSSDGGCCPKAGNRRSRTRLSPFSTSMTTSPRSAFRPRQLMSASASRNWRPWAKRTFRLWRWCAGATVSWRRPVS
jgi:hypothetical protein